VAGIFDRTHDTISIREGRIFLEERSVCLINPGSIGQPRDGDPRASFLIYDDDERTVEFFRAFYDISAVYDAIVSEGLPPYLGKRLFLGT
jgi:diadenosine tetraphosphatase ApaH/serine/threonine PP2A family protein phosphatase